MAWNPEHRGNPGVARVMPPTASAPPPTYAQPLGPLPGPYGHPGQLYDAMGGAQPAPEAPLWPSMPQATDASALPLAHTVTSSSLGMEPNVAAGLSYCGGWLTGVLVYFGERESRFVRFHAFQSIVYTSMLTVISVLAYVTASLLTDAYMTTHVHAFDTLAKGVALATFLAVLGAWWVPLVAAFNGNRLRIPYIAAYAERYAAVAPNTEPVTQAIQP